MLPLLMVEQQGAGNSISKRSAEANAWFALNVAIGQLQKEIGVDARITSPRLGTEPVDGDEHWTAVYDAWRYAENGDVDDPQDRDLIFRRWLVSGAEDLDQWPERIEILGPGTLGPSAPEEARVSVPLVEVTNGNKAGRIAWWSSDEGMKAKINAGYDSRRETSMGLSDLFYNNQSPPNMGYNAFSQLQSFNWEPGYRELASSSSQLELIAGLDDGDLGESFHDLTLHSVGVLSDVRSNR
ncbi:MAG: hypothetical protein ACPGSB_02225, partial [Opitutales bacterium]